MSKFEEVTLEELINLTTEEIKKNLNYVVSDSSIKSFRRYFEDIVTYQTISDIDGCVKVEGNPMFVSTNVAAALIGSNIRRNGNLERGERLTDRFSNLHSENTLFAKKRIVELEKEYLEDSFESKVLNTLKEVNTEEDIINPVNLIKIGTCMHDRISGYTESRNPKENEYINLAKEAWLTEKQKYIKNNLTDTVYYKILKDIFEDNDLRHYPLVTKEALESISYLTYSLDRDNSVLTPDIHSFYRMNDASKLVYMDIIDAYEDDIRECFGSYGSRHRGKAKTKIIN